MNHESSATEHATDKFQAFREKLNAKEAHRLYQNGKRYVRTHPMTTVAASLTAGLLIGYLAKTTVDRRRIRTADADRPDR